jgi:hypothetical protein
VGWVAQLVWVKGLKSSGLKGFEFKSLWKRKLLILTTTSIYIGSI